MILQALKEYYDRSSDLPRYGWELKPFPFLLQITKDGRFFDFFDTREGDGRNKRAKEFLVPSLGEKKGNGIKANLFWENIEYLLGIPVPTKGKPKPKPERISAQHNAFIEKIRSIPGECEALTTVRSFFEHLDVDKLKMSSRWEEVYAANQPLLFEIVGRGIVTDDPNLRLLIDKSRSSGTKAGICIVSGNRDEITSLEPPIKGVRGANSTGSALVSVNNKVTKGGNSGATPAFSSFMKEQGYNSPIGKQASFAYTTALNHLLRRDSSQKWNIGDASVVYWAAHTTKFESEVSDLFNDPPKDDPDRGTRAIAALLHSVKSGSYLISDRDTRFYVLGLSPNSARISVRFWKVGTVPEMAEHFARHFEDLGICHGEKQRAHISLKWLLKSIAAQGDEKNIPPNLAGETMRAILEGLPYPNTLLQAAIRRIRAEREITYPRAAIIKGCLNRLIRRNNPQHQEEIKVSLDIENTNIGYRLGRLFAVLERAQVRKFTQHGGKEPNATIRDKYYGAASSTPVTVFGNLMRLKNHHLSALENAGERVNLEKLIKEIMRGIDDFPPHLKLGDQGRFAIGYYHQKDAGFIPQEETELTQGE